MQFLWIFAVAVEDWEREIFLFIFTASHSFLVVYNSMWPTPLVSIFSLIFFYYYISYNVFKIFLFVLSNSNSGRLCLTSLRFSFYYSRLNPKGEKYFIIFFKNEILKLLCESSNSRRIFNEFRRVYVSFETRKFLVCFLDRDRERVLNY